MDSQNKLYDWCLCATLPYDVLSPDQPGFTKVLSLCFGDNEICHIEKAKHHLEQHNVDMSHICLPYYIERRIAITSGLLQRCISKTDEGLIIYERNVEINPCSSSLKLSKYRLIERIARTLEYVMERKKTFSFSDSLTTDANFNQVFPRDHEIYNLQLDITVSKDIGKDLTLCLQEKRIPHPELVFRHIVKALQALQNASLVHSLIKGDNIIFDEVNNKVTLIGFRYCKLFSEYTPDLFATPNCANEFFSNHDYRRNYNCIDFLYGVAVSFKPEGEFQQSKKYAIDVHENNVASWLWSRAEIDEVLSSDTHSVDNMKNSDILLKVMTIWQDACKTSDLYSLTMIVANMYAVLNMKPTLHMYSIMKACCHPNYKLRLSPLDLVIDEDAKSVTSIKDIPFYETVPEMNVAHIYNCKNSSLDGMDISHSFRDKAVCALGLCGKIDASQCVIVE